MTIRQIQQPQIDAQKTAFTIYKTENRDDAFLDAAIYIPHFLKYEICKKSGKLLREIPEDEIANLIYDIGLERAIVVLSKKAISHVSNRWVYTDGKGLTRLAVIDPVGYYIFCLTKTKNFAETPQGVFDMHKIRCDIEQKLMSGKETIEDLLETNDMFRVRYSYLDKPSDTMDIELLTEEQKSTPSKVYDIICKNFSAWVKKKQEADKSHGKLQIQAIEALRYSGSAYGGFPYQRLETSERNDTNSAYAFLLADFLLEDDFEIDIEYNAFQSAKVNRALAERKKKKKATVTQTKITKMSQFTFKVKGK